jgi:DNA-binding response OmpR family regulator
VFRRSGASGRAAVAGAAAAPRVEESATRSAGPKRLLVVEDDELMRRFAAEVLQGAGFEVATAVHGGEALSRLHEGSDPYDLVVLDLVLPWVNGLQVLGAMRNHDRTRSMPVLIITGTVLTMHDLAGDRYVALLRKPFDPEHLVGAVNLMLHGGAP